MSDKKLEQQDEQHFGVTPRGEALYQVGEPCFGSVGHQKITKTFSPT
jgi:hypothetical protein